MKEWNGQLSVVTDSIKIGRQEEIQNIKKNMTQSPWHTHYHVEPKTGLLNDPNGFSYFDGKWIVFYQNFPFGAVHGLKSWVQLESDDLVHFRETGVKVFS